MKEAGYLIPNMFTADPSVHLFNGRLYIYPSHDIESGIPENDNGDHFDMRDYHVFSMESIQGTVTDHGLALDIADVPWAERQMWDCDCACKDGRHGGSKRSVPNGAGLRGSTINEDAMHISLISVSTLPQCAHRAHATTPASRSGFQRHSGQL